MRSNTGFGTVPPAQSGGSVLRYDNCVPKNTRDSISSWRQNNDRRHPEPFVPARAGHVSGADRASPPVSASAVKGPDRFRRRADRCGNPDGSARIRCHRAMPGSATPSGRGASVIGKTATDEVSLGILGEKTPFTGTPMTPHPTACLRVFLRLASVVRPVCDFALGTDTGGSVACPASSAACSGSGPRMGVDFTGVWPQAPRSDTVGWFARERERSRAVCEAVFGESVPTELPLRLIVTNDTVAFADPEVAAALTPMVDRLGVPDRRPAATDFARRPVSVAGRAALLQSTRPGKHSSLDRRQQSAFAFSVARNLTLGSWITDTNERGPR